MVPDFFRCEMIFFVKQKINELFVFSTFSARAIFKLFLLSFNFFLNHDFKILVNTFLDFPLFHVQICHSINHVRMIVKRRCSLHCNRGNSEERNFKINSGAKTLVYFFEFSMYWALMSSSHCRSRKFLKIISKTPSTIV